MCKFAHCDYKRSILEGSSGIATETATEDLTRPNLFSLRNKRIINKVCMHTLPLAAFPHKN